MDGKAGALGGAPLSRQTAAVAAAIIGAARHDDVVDRRVKDPRHRRLVLDLLQGDDVRAKCHGDLAQRRVVRLGARATAGAIHSGQVFHVPAGEYQSGLRKAACATAQQDAADGH